MKKIAFFQTLDWLGFWLEFVLVIKYNQKQDSKKLSRVIPFNLPISRTDTILISYTINQVLPCEDIKETNFSTYSTFGLSIGKDGGQTFSVS